VTLAILLVLAAAAPLLNQNSPTVIPGSYIVVLKDGLGKIERDAHIAALRDHINATNAKDSEVTHIYGIGTFMGYGARMNKKLLAEQLTHPDIKYIEADAMASIDYIQEPPVSAPHALVTQTGATWGISRVSQRNWTALPNAYTYNDLGGQGVAVYVLDTGILATHVDFLDNTGKSRVTAAYTAITGEANTDLNGHGTHCTGTIGGALYGIAKNASLFAVKVLNAQGSGAWAGVIAGINYVTDNRNTTMPAVASMSLGGGKTQAVNDAVTASIATGVVYAIAAGNSNADTCGFSPASATNCVAVGATFYTIGANGITDPRSTFSNYGPCTTIFAPGQNILSDWIGASNIVTNTISGTSMATPHVAGVAALLLSAQPTLTPADVTSSLTSKASVGYVTNPGLNSPNLLLFSDPVA